MPRAPRRGAAAASARWRCPNAPADPLRHGLPWAACGATTCPLCRLPELKIKYYELMIRYHLHHNNYLEVCRAYRWGAPQPEPQRRPPPATAWRLACAPTQGAGAGARATAAPALLAARRQRLAARGA